MIILRKQGTMVVINMYELLLCDVILDDLLNVDVNDEQEVNSTTKGQCTNKYIITIYD